MRKTLQRKCSCGGQVKTGGECEECKRKRLALPRRSSSGSASVPSPDLASAGHRFSNVGVRPASRPKLRERPGHPRVERQVEDPIHEPLIEDFRRRQGLPPGGVDEFGRRVGPTAGQIKYGGLLLPPPCPDIQPNQSRDNLLRAFCLTSESLARIPECTFRSSQRRMLITATREASERVNRAHRRITSGREGRRFARGMARRLFSWRPPRLADIVSTLEGMQQYLRGGGPTYAGRTCGEETCETAVAYVDGAGQLPVYICPRAFLEPDELYRTVIHEVVHLAGIDADPATPEGYCSTFDCVTPCLTRDDADAWAHYIGCLGQGMPIRRSFLPELERSLEDLP